MAAAAAAEEVQTLLRFLTKDARLPLTEAMPKINSLRKLKLATPDAIAKANHADLKVVFADEKSMKQVLNAAKRVSNPKKREPPLKRAPANGTDATTNQEAALALPETLKSEDELHRVTVETNRAPLFLAFTVSVLKHTQPTQPLSSRLSLAQAVVSAGAASRAKYLGITAGPTAEDDGWAQGQPKIRIMGREVAVMRRQMPAPAVDEDSQTTVKEEDVISSTHEAFWGIDLEALRKSNGPLVAGQNIRGQSGPPIHQPQAARAYLLKSMKLVPESHEEHTSTAKQPPKKLSSAEIVAQREEAVAMVLKATDIVLTSWIATLTVEELDRRAQTWYAMVRPEVADGQAGWGQRGQVHLRDILQFKRE